MNRANFIDGGWCASASGRTYEKRDPFRPRQVTGEFPASDERDVERAVEAAAAAFPEWSRMSGQRRGEILFRAADAIERRAEEIAAGHDARDGQAAARVADRGGARRRHAALSGR